MEYADFFRRVTGREPYPYQRRFAEAAALPTLLNIPTGLGKTACVVVGWLWRRYFADAAIRAQTPRRLVYCLPMRVLVQQSAAFAQEVVSRLAAMRPERVDAAQLPGVHVLMGGEVSNAWEQDPQSAAILVGTQDQLLSRALNRGYGLSRYRWPIGFGLLHNDACWVFDETQLMGVGVETSAQLQGLRSHLGTLLASTSIWMSATLRSDPIATVDHRPPAEGGWPQLQLGAEDLDDASVRQRVHARKALTAARSAFTAADKKGYAKAVAAEVLAAHHAGTLTLVFVNRVKRAQEIYQALRKAGRSDADTFLVHSRFRQTDRQRQERCLEGAGDRIVVATQALEAGVDISAATLFTELAPWSSLVQRFGRCNRYGEHELGQVFWIDIDEKADAAPYAPARYGEARQILRGLDACGPEVVRGIADPAPAEVRPVLRRKDLLELFDNSADLSGDDIDVGLYIRDADDLDVEVFWRDFGADSPENLPKVSPAAGECCAVGVGAIRDFVKRLARGKDKASEEGEGEDRALGKAKNTGQEATKAWRWDGVEGQWAEISHEALRPGMVVLLHSAAGGYEPELGWTGEGKRSVPVLGTDAAPLDAVTADPATRIGCWVDLSTHLADVYGAAATTLRAQALPSHLEEALLTAAAWHDVGKAHPAFQKMLSAHATPPSAGLWAKSAVPTGRHQERPHFRHELASALAWLQCGGDNLTAFLIATHHGKVRLSLRAMPREREAPAGRAFVCGVWDGDVLPAVALPNGATMPETCLDLSVTAMGPGCWIERMLSLRDDPDLGPFRLAYLEALLRNSDQRASAAEAREGGENHG